MSDRIIRDFQDRLHPVCPRCKLRWQSGSVNLYCENKMNSYGKSFCMFAIRSGIKPDYWVLTTTLSQGNTLYLVMWNFEKKCLIKRMVNGIWDDVRDDIQLPLLPYNISFDKLKTYLLFS